MHRGPRFLAFGGTAIVVLGLAQVHAVYIGNYDLGSSSRFVWTLAYVGLLCVSTYAVGLPDTLPKLKQSLAAACLATFIAAIGISLLQLAAGSALLPRFVVTFSALFLIPWYAICADISANERSRREERDRVVMVGGASEISALGADLAASPEKPASLVGSITVEELQSRPSDTNPLILAVEEAGASLLVLDVAAQAIPSIITQAAQLHERGIRIRSLSLFYEEWLGKLPLTELERVSLMFDIGEVHRAVYGRQKRVFDVGVAFVAIVAAIVVVPLVFIGNLFANRGKLLYRQERVGKNGKLFTILKFRTMTSETTDTSWTQEGDTRVTRFGRFLRRSHIDELPQVWNVLKGDLSIVGPRPEQPNYVEELAEKIVFYDLRHLVRPGVTGWAQIKYAYGSSVTDALQKLQYEFFYLRHQGLTLDARIIARTIRHMVRRSGR